MDSVLVKTKVIILEPLWMWGHLKDKKSESRPFRKKLGVVHTEWKCPSSFVTADHAQVGRAGATNNDYVPTMKCVLYIPSATHMRCSFLLKVTGHHHHHQASTWHMTPTHMNRINIVYHGKD